MLLSQSRQLTQDISALLGLMRIEQTPSLSAAAGAAEENARGNRHEGKRR